MTAMADGLSAEPGAHEALPDPGAAKHKRLAATASCRLALVDLLQRCMPQLLLALQVPHLTDQDGPSAIRSPASP